MIRRIERYNLLAERTAGNSFQTFLNFLTINTRSEKHQHPTPFREAADPWQHALAARVAPTIEFACGARSVRTGPRFIWLTMPRGHDKTTFIGRCLNYLLAFSRHKVIGVAAAGDKDQAGFLAEAMETEAHLNPWLAKRLEFKHGKVVGAQSSLLRILAADAPSSYGLTPDFMVMDELTHWAKQDLWNALVTAREKRPHSIILIITNAGVIGTWQYEVLVEAKRSMVEDGLWWVYEAPGPIASWMSATATEQMRRMLPEGEFQRVILNRWVDPSTEWGFVPREDAEACVDNRLILALRGDPSYSPYLGAIDYGPSKDRTVCVIGHREGDPPSVVIDRMDVYEGKNFPGRRVPITEVERWIDMARSDYGVSSLVIDPYQMESVIQKYEMMMPIERFEPRGGKANYELAQCLRSLILNRRLRWYPSCGDLFVNGRRHTTADEFAELITRTTASGYRMDHLPKAHDDRAVAIGMLCVGLVRTPVRRPLLFGDGFF